MLSIPHKDHIFKDEGVIAVYFRTYFLPLLSNFKTFFLSFHTLTNHEHQDKTQDIIVLVQRQQA